MKCSMCNRGLPAGHTLCAACAHKSRYNSARSPSATSDPFVRALQTAATHWFGAKAAGPTQSPHRAVGTGLPEEFTQIPTRAATDIPGQPEASRLAALDKEHQRRIQGMERGRMIMEFVRDFYRASWPRRS
jgi:hypothetical protein